MNPELEMLTQLGTEAVQTAITEYTRWFLAHAFAWMAFGVFLLGAARWIWNKAVDIEDEFDLGCNLTRIAAITIALLGALTFPVNIPDVVSPRAYAIHQLITDARGK